MKSGESTAPARRDLAGTDRIFTSQGTVSTSRALNAEATSGSTRHTSRFPLRKNAISSKAGVNAWGRNGDTASAGTSSPKARSAKSVVISPASAPLADFPEDTFRPKNSPTGDFSACSA